MRGEGKVAAQHVGRTALIYVRQSTMAQVREYALAEEAARLGWPASSIEEVIDADLGVSAGPPKAGTASRCRTPPVKGVGEPCAGEPHARFDGRGLETGRFVTAPVPDPSNLGSVGGSVSWR